MFLSKPGIVAWPPPDVSQEKGGHLFGERMKKLTDLTFFSVAGATDGHHHHETNQRVKMGERKVSSFHHFPFFSSFESDGPIGAAALQQPNTNRHITQRRAFVPAPFRLRNQSKNVLVSCFRIERKGRSETKQKKKGIHFFDKNR